MTNGKGSQRRPRQVSRKQYDENWDAVFGAKRTQKELLDELTQLSQELCPEEYESKKEEVNDERETKGGVEESSEGGEGSSTTKSESP